MVKNVHFSVLPRPALESTKPPIQWVPGALYQGVKRQGREADDSLPTSAEVNETCLHASTPPYACMAYFLVKYKNNFTFFIMHVFTLVI
jgi:hypothetical protein